MSEKIVQLNEKVIKGQIKELVRGSVEETLNELLEKEAEQLTQAARYERSESRQGYRSGHYDRNLTTTSGDVTLHMPRLKGVTFETAIIERYADDCVIVVGSEASANRVMRTITDWIERKLGLKVNATKTHITKPSNLKYLGFSFWKDSEKWRARLHEASVQKYKKKLKARCKRSWSIDLTTRIQKINEVTRGWVNYFAVSDMKTNMA